MEKGKIITILVIIIVLAIFSLSIYSYIQNPTDSNKENQTPQDNPTETQTSNNPIGNQESSNAITSTDSTSNSSSSSEDSTSSTPEETINPEDYECGFYFQEYQVCAGSCPEGECVSEGQSCYCQ